MAEGPTISRLKEAQQVEIDLLVLSKSLQTTKNGQPYLSLELGDKTGRIDGKVWDEAEKLNAVFDEGDAVRLKGRVGSYQGRKQIVITDLKRLEGQAADPARFLKSAERPAGEMMAELLALADSLAEPFNTVCRAVLTDPETAERLATAPAAKHAHHAYLGGLIEHTLSVARLAERIARHYPFLRRDLLLAGALLHDVGKALELDLKPGPDYSTSGRLIGHVVLGVEMVRRHLPDDMDPKLADELLHLIVSHHGLLEFGSPRLPQTLEAVALNLADDLDAKMAGMKARLDEAEDEWTGFVRIYDRHLYRGVQGHSSAAAPEPTNDDQAGETTGRRRSRRKQSDDQSGGPGLFG